MTPAQAHWNRAAREMKFKVLAPFSYRDEMVAFSCDAHLPEFGGGKGTVVLCRDSLDEDHEEDNAFFAAAAKAGFSASIMLVPAQFDSNVFKDALRDWGYSGDPSYAPQWC